MITPVHDFNKSLEQSHAASDLPFWKECYKKAFPTMVGFHDHRGDGEHQRKGIDRSVILANGRQIWIDEKVRGRNKKTGQVYEDIALEELSDERRQTPGWVVKPLLCDYIAYAIAPIGKCYLLPVIQLQLAWMNNCTFWKDQYFEVRAENKGYTTVSWAIPVDVLFKAMGACLRIQFDALEMTE